MDGNATLVGFVMGMIITILLFWLLYDTRSFVFANCPVNQKQCSSADYYNDPGDAIANGYSASDILTIVDGVMYYTRVPKNDDCTPGPNQTVQITNPQYCLFTPTTGGNSVVGKSVSFNNYNYLLEGTSSSLTTNGNCIPQGSSYTGEPILEWNPNLFG